MTTSKNEAPAGYILDIAHIDGTTTTIWLNQETTFDQFWNAIHQWNAASREFTVIGLDDDMWVLVRDQIKTMHLREAGTP